MEAINLENQFNKALRLLDFGKVERALDLLNEIIIEAQKENNNLYFIRASCVLGEFLFLNGEIEKCKHHLLNVVNTIYDDDVVEYEKSTAAEILNQIE